MFLIKNSTYPTTPVQWSSGKNYLEFRNLVMDGNELATNAFSCDGSHHVTFVGNTTKNTGGGGGAEPQSVDPTVASKLLSHYRNSGWNRFPPPPLCGWVRGA